MDHYNYLKLLWSKLRHLPGFDFSFQNISLSTRTFGVDGHDQLLMTVQDLEMDSFAGDYCSY